MIEFGGLDYDVSYSYLCFTFIFFDQEKVGWFCLEFNPLYISTYNNRFFGLGFLFWALAVGHAGWHLKKEAMVEQAELIAQKMSNS